MVDLFIKLYNFKFKSSFFTFLRPIIRFIFKYISNIFLPIYFKATPFAGGIRKHNKFNKKLIVSLTTYPARIDKIWIVIESILRQSYSADEIFLWLSKNQFPSRDSLPNNLIKIEKKGLTICFVDEDFKSHKKYFYAFKRFPNDLIVTVDDDIIYSPYLLERLINSHGRFPKTICCDRGLKMIKKNSKILPYNKWEFLHSSFGPSFSTFQTSGGGTLFPPLSFTEDVFNSDVFMRYCKLADDIWLNLMAIYSDTKTYKTDNEEYILPLLFFSATKSSLSDYNLYKNLNDTQLNEVRSYYIRKFNKDPLNNFLIS